MRNKILLFATLLLFPLLAIAQNQKKVAVYVMGEDSGIKDVLESKLVSVISRSEDFVAVERTEAFLAQLSKEQKYQRTGAVDDSELSRLGKQFGVQYICVAEISEAFSEKYLSARLIDVESAQVEYSASSSGAIQNVSTAINAAEAVSEELLSSFGKSRQSNVKKVAVYVVRNDAGKNIGKVLGDKLVGGFTNSGRYVAVERTNGFLQQLNKEQKYQRTGAVNDNDISRLGKQFGVQYVCVAKVSDVYGEKFISARLIDVETAEVVNSQDVGGTINSMDICVNMTNEIAFNLSKGTFAEQAEETRIKAAEEARIRAEQEARIKAEQEARIRAEQEARRREEAEKERIERAKQARVEKRKQELRKMLNDGYVVLRDHDGIKWMVCLEPIVLSSKDYKTAIEKGEKFSRCGYYDWVVSSWESYNVRNYAVSNEEMHDYVSGKSDECINYIWYIANEFEHYLGISFPLWRNGYYWHSYDTLAYKKYSWSTKRNVLFLDGVVSRELVDSSDGGLIFKSRDSSKFKQYSQAAFAFLVRRM